MMIHEMDEMDEMDTPPPDPAEPERPVQIIVTDDLDRSRLTVFFRLLLAIPHLVVLFLWGLAAVAVAVVMWLAVVFEGRAPRSLHGFVASYVRYSAHVGAYLALLANPYPAFGGSDPYPVDVTVAAPERQNRWSAAFRLILALPALALATTLAGGPMQSAGSFDSESTIALMSGGGVLVLIGVLGWFACLVRGAMPRGLRDLGVFAVGYSAQTSAYLLLLTDRYPTSDPGLAIDPAPELPRHPVRIEISDGLERSRLTVLLRFPLSVPHFVWLALWSVPALLAAFIAWVLTLTTGRVPRPLHRFLAAFTRYASHVTLFFFLVGGPFPGFVGAAGSYPVAIEIDGPLSQPRLVTLFRGLLALPAFLLSAALGGVLVVVGFLGFWHAIVTGRMPEGLRNLGAACVRYSAQLNAYVFLVTPRYPYASPALVDLSPPDEEEALVPAGLLPWDREGGAEAEAESF